MSPRSCRRAGAAPLLMVVLLLSVSMEQPLRLFRRLLPYLPVMLRRLLQLLLRWR